MTSMISDLATFTIAAIAVIAVEVSVDIPSDIPTEPRNAEMPRISGLQSCLHWILDLAPHPRVHPWTPGGPGGPGGLCQ